MLRSSVLLLTTLIFAVPAQADLYLGVRPADQLSEDQSIGTFVGTWDRVILDITADDVAEVQSLEQLTADHGSVFAALRLARTNTQALLGTLSYEDAGQVSRILSEPLAAVSGLILLDEFAAKIQGDLDLPKVNLILPMGDLMVVQVDLSPEIDDPFADLATRLTSSSPLGLDDQVLSYADGQYSRIGGTEPTPTPEEILMSLGSDPENTLVITLKDGDVVIRMRDDLAPNHVARIKELARDGFYDGIVFHRVIEGFMAQTGDPTGTGTSGSGQNLNAEFTDAPFLRGTVGMARAASPNSADSQFFIMFAEGRFLDNNYTVIGQVESGMEFVDNIKRGEPPVDPDKMISVKVQADL